MQQKFNVMFCSVCFINSFLFFLQTCTLSSPDLTAKGTEIENDAHIFDDWWFNEIFDLFPYLPVHQVPKLLVFSKDIWAQSGWKSDGESRNNNYQPTTLNFVQQLLASAVRSMLRCEKKNEYRVFHSFCWWALKHRRSHCTDESDSFPPGIIYWILFHSFIHNLPGVDFSFLFFF